jgi:hypothetical protein
MSEVRLTNNTKHTVRTKKLSHSFLEAIAISPLMALFFEQFQAGHGHLVEFVAAGHLPANAETFVYSGGHLVDCFGVDDVRFEKGFSILLDVILTCYQLVLSVKMIIIVSYICLYLYRL